MEGWAREITNVVWVPDLPGTTPARVNHRTGVMELSIRQMKPMPVELRLFIMLHEMGHVVLQTLDEEQADAWAFQQYAEMGYSLTAAVKALTRVLNPNSPAHVHRMQLQLERALAYDREHYSNLII